MIRWIKIIVLAPLHALAMMQKVYSGALTLAWPDFSDKWKDRVQLSNINRFRKVSHLANDQFLFEGTFIANNPILRMRAKTFSEKEPDTLRWLDSAEQGEVLFDIGANVGIYSVYYAKRNNGKVFSFEPSPFNLGVLVRNIELNSLQDRIYVLPIPLTMMTSLSDFSLSSLVEGGAHSSFGVDFGFDGRKLEKELSFKTVGFSLDDLFRFGVIKEYPSRMKIDVDGIEHLILSGASDVLRCPTLKTILIEVTETFQTQKKGVEEILSSSGFSLKSKNIRWGNVPFSNQIWHRI